MNNHIYRINDEMWFIGANLDQVLELYHREYDDEAKPEDFIEETNLEKGGYWSNDVPIELIKKVWDIVEQEASEDDTLPEVNEGDEWFIDTETYEPISGSIRRWDDEFWIWTTFQEELNKYDKPLESADLLCSNLW